MLGTVLSGQVVPIDMLPLPVQTVCAYLPFQHIYYTPIRMFLNEGSPSGQLSALGAQLVWLCAALYGTRLLFVRGLCRYESQEMR